MTDFAPDACASFFAAQQMLQTPAGPRPEEGCKPINLPTQEIGLRSIPCRFVFEHVAAFYGVTVTDLVSERRTGNIVWPRQIAMYLARRLTRASLPRIGSVMGDRDHTTISHGVKKIRAALEHNDQLRAEVLELMRRILLGFRSSVEPANDNHDAAYYARPKLLPPNSEERTRGPRLRMKGSWWTDEREAELAALFRRGLPHPQIAERMGRSVSAITWKLHQLGLRRRRSI